MRYFKSLTLTLALAAALASLFAFVAVVFGLAESEDEVAGAFEATMEWAEEDVHEFWDAAGDTYGIDYEAPRRVEYYDSEYDTPCGETIPNNAFYCSEDHSIYLDRVFLEQYSSELGEYAAVYILAHEWGHLVQDDLGILTSPNFSIQVEVQADCFAGAYTKALDEVNETFTEEDLQAALGMLTQVGDPDRYPWFAPGAHGSSEQRVKAFEIGYDGGFEACTAPPFAQVR